MQRFHTNAARLLGQISWWAQRSPNSLPSSSIKDKTTYNTSVSSQRRKETVFFAEL